MGMVFGDCIVVLFGFYFSSLPVASKHGAFFGQQDIRMQINLRIYIMYKNNLKSDAGYDIDGSMNLTSLPL